MVLLFQLFEKTRGTSNQCTEQRESEKQHLQLNKIYDLLLDFLNQARTKEMRLINGICMESHREVKHYSGNTTNMRVHLMHHVG